MALHSPILPAAPTQTQRQAQTFEFIKRKNWADILLSELPDTVILVLDTDAQIQYVGPTSHEVLGWQVEELSETDILDIVNDDDKKSFNDHFERSLSSKQDLFCYARLKCKPISKAAPERGPRQKELLFEIRGHALYVPNDSECKCFFLSAKPSPSRNMAALNTFLELKIENERLTQRLRDLKAQEDVTPGRVHDSPVSAPQTAMSDSQFANIEFSRSQDTMMHGSSSLPVSNFNTTQDGFIHSTARSVNSRDEDDEEGGKKKKKSKKIHTTAQYVCVICGRTDSPEWRKGPRGPKTLCNACGLRWAKRSKRTDDVPIPYVQGQGSRKGQEGTRSTTPTSVTSGRGGKGMPISHPALSVTPTMGTPPTTQPVQQQQVRQERYDSQLPSASPAQPAVSQTSMAPQTQTPSAAGQYAMHALAAAAMHHQNVQQPLASPHEFSHAQPQGHYHGYELYPWLMNHQQREGGYGC